MRNRNLPRHVGFIIALVTMIQPVIAQAAYAPVSRNLCSLGIYPYNPSAVGGDVVDQYATSWFNLFNQSDSQCTDRLFPWEKAYTPQPPLDGQTPLKSVADVENKKAPYALHNHRYYNDSVESDGKVYKSFIDKFVVTIQSDGRNSTHFENLSPVCYTWDWNQGGEAGAVKTVGCNTHLSMYGGTNISYNSSTGVITWEFGVDSSPKSGRPYRFGNDPTIDSRGNNMVPYNTSLEENRKFPVAVKLVTKNNPDEIWSGTTTSKVLVRDLALRTDSLANWAGSSCSSAGDYTHWCTPPRPAISSINGILGWETIDGKDYYWIKIGSVGTVWKKPTPPGPPTCSNLTLTPATLNPSGSTVMTAKVTLSDGSVHNATIQWTPTGGTMSGPLTQSGPTNSNLNNTYNLADPNIGGSVKAKVTSIADGVILPLSGVCSDGKEVKTPPITPDCLSLTISPTGPFTEIDIPTSGPGKTITVTSATKGGLNLSYKWESSVPGLIKFDGNPGTYIDLNKTTGLTRTGAITAPVTVTVTGVNASNTAESFAPVCKKTLTINPPPRPYCEYVSLNKLTISNTSSDSVSATVHYNDGIDRNTEVYWSPFNLALTPATNPETHNSVVPFTKTTNPLVPGSPVSLNAKVTGVPLGVDLLPGSACAVGLTASSGGGNQCLSLNNNGYTGTTVAGGASVLLAPDPSNVNPPPPPQVTWTVSGQGVLIRNPAAPFPFNQDFMCPAVLSNTSVSLPRGCQYFYSTTSATGTSGFVTITANPNLGNVAACTQTVSFNNTPNGGSCVGLNWSLQPDGKLCVSPIGTFSGNYQWTIGGSTFTNGTCQNVPPNTAVHVEGVGAPQCSVNIPPQTQNNQCNYVTPSYNGTQLCLNVNGVYNGPFTWQINGGTPFNNGLCQNVAPDSTVNVNGPNPACSLVNYKTPPNPPKFSKTVRALYTVESGQGEKSGTKPLTLVPEIDGKIVEYKLVFTPTSPFTTTTITDDMSKGYIQGKTNTGSDGGRIVYNDNMSVSVPFCGTGSGALKSNCYTGDIGTPAGITLLKVSNPVTITYQGKVTGSLLTEENCTNNANNICQEKYPNMASANYAVYPNVSSTTPSTTGLLNANAIVQSFCQYILTRAAGDIYLETDLTFGKDIRLCTDYTSSTGLIVTPGPEIPPGAPQTGPGTVPIGHEVCSQGLSIPTSGKVYGENAASTFLSSQICEVKLRPGESWSKSTITSTIQENKTRISRWAPNLDTVGTTQINSFDTGLPESNTGVYHITNNNLTIGSGLDGADVTLNKGAKTFIVEGHDLIIKNNITYGDCADCTVRNTPSLAFIVLGGNVLIDPSVTEVSGVFFVQQGAQGSDTGKLKALGSGTGADSYTKLTIYGSVYGDIQDLFTHHKFAGDPSANDGSVVIRFDERIILNTPPGLQDILQLSQSEVAR